MPVHVNDAKAFHVRKHAKMEGGRKVSAGYTFACPIHEGATVPMSSMENWERDSFAVLSNKSTVTYPGGPLDDPYRRINLHVVTHCDEVSFHCNDGHVHKYKVVHNPGKYYTADELPVTDDMERYGKEASHMDWFYLLEKVDG